MEFFITSEPFEGAINQLLALINEKGRGPEAKEALETIKKRFCKDDREKIIAEEAYKTGKLRVWYYPSEPVRAR